MSELRNGAIVHTQPGATAAGSAWPAAGRSRIAARHVVEVTARSSALADVRLVSLQILMTAVLAAVSLAVLAATWSLLSLGTSDIDAFLPLAAALQLTPFPTLRHWGLLALAGDRLFAGSAAMRIPPTPRRERDAALETILASIAHEVRQPLSTIATRGDATLRFLERDPTNLERIRSNLAAIVEESHRASQVFDNVRALFSSAELDRQPIDVNQIATGALRILRHELEQRGVATRAELTPGLPPVMGHAGQIQEVILNLLHNALEAMDTVHEGRRMLVVRTERRGRDAIAVAVEDSGPGIDPARLKTIFDPFVTTKSRGTGLGLAICRMTIERHGGQLSASRGEMRGALFQFVLPVRLTASAAAAEFRPL